MGESDESLFVNITKLSEDGNVLVTKGDEICSIIESLDDLLDDDWEEWIGEDNEAFVDSLRDDLDTINCIGEEISKIGDFMVQRADDYSEDLSNCLEGMSGNV